MGIERFVQQIIILISGFSYLILIRFSEHTVMVRHSGLRGGGLWRRVL
jgi:hypothetical protein